MSTKTDSRLGVAELPLRSLLVIIGTAFVALLIVVFVSRDRPGHFRGSFDDNFSIISFQAPHMTAGELTIQSGLDEFSGGKAKPMSARVASGLALGFLLSYVIGPVFLLRWFRRRLLGEKDKLPRISAIAGVFLTASWMLLAVPGFIGQIRVSARLKIAQSVQMAKDDMINALTHVANAAQQYRILPKRLGGGEGSFEGFVIPAEFAGDSTATAAGTRSGGLLVKWFPMRISAMARRDEIEFFVVPLMNPRSRYTDEPLQPVPNAGVRTTLLSDGHMRNWVYTGLFQ